ncbi:MAG: ABC transporter permease, partial [Clostridia bacterium]|nr:ABC transporter permease [Clostridia bacterium]
MKDVKKRIRPLRFIKKYGRLLLGGIIILSVLFVAVFAPLLTDQDPYQLDLVNGKQTPSADHPLGTDRFGRDILSRIMYGA